MRFQFAFPHTPFDRSPRSRAILRAAKQVFVQEGYAGLSIRAVAKAARASMGAVQNFFPTKRELIAALFEYVVNEYEQGYQRLFARLPINGEARLLAVLDYLVDDLWRAETRHFFFGLWALGVNHPPARHLIREMYLHHRRGLAALVSGARPGLSEARCQQLALVLAALIEGLMLFTGPGSGQGITRASLRTLVRTTALEVIAPAPAGPTVAPRRARVRRARQASSASPSGGQLV